MHDEWYATTVKHNHPQRMCPTSSATVASSCYDEVHYSQIGIMTFFYNLYLFLINITSIIVVFVVCILDFSSHDGFFFAKKGNSVVT